MHGTGNNQANHKPDPEEQFPVLGGTEWDFGRYAGAVGSNVASEQDGPGFEPAGHLEPFSACSPRRGQGELYYPPGEIHLVNTACLTKYIVFKTDDKTDSRHTTLLYKHNRDTETYSEKANWENRE